MLSNEERDRIKILEYNKKINKELYQSGKRDRETYLICRKDGQSVINRIKNKE